MGSTATGSREWQELLEVRARDHGVPGATVGILRTEPEEITELAYGVLSMATGVDVTPDSVFQIGSLTKIWTAALAVQLSEEGQLDLDAPVVNALPELRLSDPEATARVTMRHLLSHSSGIDGDFYLDTGRGDDCVALYVDQLIDVPQIFAPGASFSYSNSAFILAGRVIETLTGQTWDQAVRVRLIDQLELEHTSTLPEEALLQRAAVGHLAIGGGPIKPVSRWILSRSSGPAARITASARDVLEFVQLHLRGGATRDRRQLLSPLGVRSMQQHYVTVVNPPTPGAARGLGWGCANWNGHRVLQHDGETHGQLAFLRVFPDDDLAIVMLTNGGQASALFDDLMRDLLPELRGFAPPTTSDPKPGRNDSDLGRFVGRYERISTSYDITAGDGLLLAHITNESPGDEGVSSYDREFVPAGEVGSFNYRSPGSSRWSTAQFFEVAGRRYLHDGGRAAPRIDP